MKKLIIFCLLSIGLSACYDGQKPADITQSPIPTMMGEQNGRIPSGGPITDISPIETTPSPSQQTKETSKPRPSFDNDTIKTSKAGFFPLSWASAINIWDTWAKSSLVRKYTNMRLISTSFVRQAIDYSVEKGLELAGQDDVKAIVALPAIEHIQYAFQAIKEEYPDHLLIAIASKDGMEIPAADIVINYDYYADASLMPNQAKELGAKTFVYYSYEGCLDKQVIAKHQDIIQAECEKIGLQFAEVTVPCFNEDAPYDIAEFISKDIPKQIELYGRDTNFYSMYGNIYTIADACFQNGAMSVFQYSIFGSLLPPYPILIEPYNIPDEKITDFLYINQQIEDIVAEKGMTGRLSTWPVSFSHLAGEAAIKYALTYADGYPELKTLDKEFFYQCLKDTMAEFGYPDHNVYINTYDEFGDNYIFISQDYIVY